MLNARKKKERGKRKDKHNSMTSSLEDSPVYCKIIMIRFGIATTVVTVATAALFQRRQQGAKCDEHYPFDTEEFPEIFTPAIPVRPQTPSVFTVGNGTIYRSTYLSNKQKLCRVSLALPASSLDRAKTWEHDHRRKRSEQTLAEYLLQRVNIITPYTISNPLKVALTLRFQQTISVDDFLRLFDDVFEGAPKRTYRDFVDSLKLSLEQDRINSGQEIAFYWFDDGDVMITKDGDVCGRSFKEEANRRLLLAFLDGDKSLCKELVTNVQDHLPIM